MHILIVEISVKWKTDGLFHCISDSNINKFATSLLLNNVVDCTTMQWKVTEHLSLMQFKSDKKCKN